MLQVSVRKTARPSAVAAISRVQSRFFASAYAPANQFNMLLFGAPGVGKGTYGKMVQKDFDVKAFSTGDYLREIVKRSKRQQEIDQINGQADEGLDAFSQKISDTLSAGKLIDDEIVVDIVRNLKENPSTFLDGAYAKTAGLILDGVPRTVAQAEMLDEFLSIDLVLNFEHSDDVLI